MDARRRRFLSRFPLAVVATAAVATAASAQPSRTRRPVRIGRLSPLAAETDAAQLEAFGKGLADLGWVPGQDFTIEARFADGRADRLPGLASELVRERVDLILAGSTQGVRAAKGATTTIPILMVTTGDPVADGLVPSLAHPGGNVTGITALGQVLDTKRLEILKETVPGIARVGVILDPNSPYTRRYLKEKDDAARALGLDLQIIGIPDLPSFDRIPALVGSQRFGALLVQTNVLFVAHRPRLVERINGTRIPAVYGEREFVEHGGLMFYGASLVTMYRDAATYADRLFKGAKPSELPVVQPTKIELVVNARTARAQGVTIPGPVLLRADRIID
jgi:putative ABC transport system substrate-binding protein